MNIQAISQYINQLWDQSILPTLQDYIRIPNKSPAFDPEWQKNGHIERAVMLIKDWCTEQAIDNMALEVVRLPNRTPLIFIDIPGNNNDTVLLYGHLDKQPEMTGWDEGLDPWTPVLRGDRLYGRGSADDGYAVFASLTAVKALRAENIPHSRCVIIIEACEESGSIDLPFYIDALKDRIGQPSLVICLDSGCGNYEQMWVTTSLRGMIGGVLDIKVLKEGVHSGRGSGIVPSCFRILRELLDRVENASNGEILLSDLQVAIPENRMTQTAHAVDVLGDTLYKTLPFLNGVEPQTKNLQELLLNQTWRPTLSVTGLNGLPKNENAGNVTVPELSVKLSLRLPPTCDAEKAVQAVKQALETSPPYQAKVQFTVKEQGAGWNAPTESAWLLSAVNESSQHFFGKAAVYLSEGASIPFMGMLGKKFPQAQFLITGVLGPESNAHGPNEFLHIPTGKKLTACVAEVIAKQYQTSSVSPL